MAFDAASCIYTVDVMKFTVDDVEYAVNGVVASVQESGIPVISLSVNPEPNPNPKNINVPALSDFLNWHSQLQSLASTKKGRAALSMSLVSVSDTQSIDIASWVLTQAGVLEVSASGSFSTQLVIQHPIYGAVTAVLAMLNTYKAAGNGEKAEGGDVAAAIMSAMEIYLKQRDPGSAEAGEVDPGSRISADTIVELDKAMHAKAVEALDSLKANMEFDPDYSGVKFPFEGIDATIVDLYYRVGGIFPDPYLDGRESVYGTFMNMITQMGLMTYGSFSDDKLRTRPAEPWAGADMTLLEQEVSSVAMPTESRGKVNGVAVMGLTGNKEVQENNSDPAGGVQPPQDNNLSMCGAFIDYINIIEGSLRLVSVPDYLTGYMNGNSTGATYEDPDLTNSPTAEDSGGDNPGERAAMVRMDAISVEMMNAYCHDEFWRAFNADAGLGLVTRLTVARGGLTLRPGRILSLNSSDGTTLYTCYITAVQHVVSPQDGRAYTAIQGAYARGKDGIKDVYTVGTPVVSAVYGAGEGGGAAAGDGAEAGGESSEREKMSTPPEDAYIGLTGDGI